MRPLPTLALTLAVTVGAVAACARSRPAPRATGAALPLPACVGVTSDADDDGLGDARELARFAWVDGVRGGAPVVWVARGKHGGYPTRDDCDAGHWGFDSCDGNTESFRFPVDAARNIGSRARPAGCVTGAALALASVDPAARECPWDEGQPFRGWQRHAGDGPPGSSYARQLARFGGP